MPEVEIQNSSQTIDKIILKYPLRGNEEAMSREASHVLEKISVYKILAVPVDWNVTLVKKDGTVITV